MEIGTLVSTSCKSILFSRTLARSAGECWRSALRCVSAMLIVAHFPAMAGTNTWTPMGLQGGTVFDLAFHPTTPSTMYAVAPNGFYRSIDSGATWQQTPIGSPTFYFVPSSLAIAAGNPDRVHIGMRDGGAALSLDRGGTFRRTTPGPLPSQAETWSVAAASDGSVVYYAVNDSVYRSSDQGVSMQLRGAVPSGGLISQLRIDSGDFQVIHAANFGGGLFRSVDGGVAWQSVFAPVDLTMDGVWGFAIDPQNVNRIWVATNGSLRVSVDGGLTWTAVLNDTVSDIDIDPATPNVVYASLVNGAVMRTADGGTTWVALPVPQRATMGRARLAIAPGQSNRLYIFGTTGIFSSADAGTTWLRADAGIDATSPGRFARTTAGAERTYFPIAEYGIGAIRSDGSAVVLLSPSLSFAAGAHPPPVTAVAAGGDQSRQLVAVMNAQTIAFSDDHGSNWSLASTPPTQVQITGLTWAGARTVYAATSAGAYRSEDGGNHWTAGAGFPFGAAVTSLVPTADPLTLFAITQQTGDGTSAVYKSSDAGVTWAPTAGQVSAIWQSSLTPHPTDAQVLFLGSATGSFKTTNGGATWTAIQSQPDFVARAASPLAIDPVNPQILYFSDVSIHSSRLFRSADGGATFQNLASDYFTGGQFVSLLIDAAGPDRIVASLSGGGVREFTVTPDLQISLTPSGATPQGRQATLTARVTNLGPYDATTVRLQAELLDAATGVSATSTAATCSVAGSSLTCSSDVLRTGASIDVVLLATPTAAGSFRVNATAAARQPDPLSANNSASAAVTVTSAASSAPSTGGGGGGVASGWEILLLFALLVVCWARRGPSRQSCG